MVGRKHMTVICGASALLVVLLLCNYNSGILQHINFPTFPNWHNGALSKNKWTPYTKVGKEQFFIYSAIAGKADKDLDLNHITITGWEPRTYVTYSYKCCFYTKEGGLAFSNSTGKRVFHTIRANGIEARQVLCKFPADIHPERINLKLLEEDCSTKVTGDIITYPKTEREDKFVVCGKIIYGKKNPLHLIEWIEFHIHFGANNLVLYAYQDLNNDAWRVLRYYIDTMKYPIEVIPMSRVPAQKKWPRHFATRGSMELLNDEQVQIYDTLERFREYKYLAIIDTDEFVAPNMSLIKSYPELMKHLMATYQTAGTFQLQTQLYITSWGKTDPTNDLLITQYCNRTETGQDRMKLIHVNDRIRPETVWIHNGVPKQGYKKVQVNDTEVVLKHYRTCRDEWLTNTTKTKCFGGFRMQYDPYMNIIARKIGSRIRKTRDTLGL